MAIENMTFERIKGLIIEFKQLGNLIIERKLLLQQIDQKFNKAKKQIEVYAKTIKQQHTEESISRSYQDYCLDYENSQKNYAKLSKKEWENIIKQYNTYFLNQYARILMDICTLSGYKHILCSLHQSLLLCSHNIVELESILNLIDSETDLYIFQNEIKIIENQIVLVKQAIEYSNIYLCPLVLKIQEPMTPLKFYYQKIIRK